MIVKYSKKFPYAPYLNEDIGFEESIMDGASEEAMLAALQRLSDVALKFHKANNPQIQFDPELCAPPKTVRWSEPPYGNIPVEQVEKTLGTVGALIKDIDSCQSIKVLESYKFMVRKDVQLQASYDKKMAELLSTANKSMG